MRGHRAPGAPGGPVRGSRAREPGLAAARRCGLALGGLFGTWIPAVHLTSVASAVALLATQPVWAALIARSRGRRIGRGAWLGILLAVAGVLTLTGVDAGTEPRALLGDGLALLGAAFAAAYFSLGERTRQVIPALILLGVGLGIAILSGGAAAPGERASGRGRLRRVRGGLIGEARGSPGPAD